MRFFATAALVGAATAATLKETATIKDLNIRDNNGIQAASLKIASANVNCSATSAEELADNKVVGCGETKYRFAVTGSVSTYVLSIWKQTGDFVGIYGNKTINPVCTAGGNGPKDYVCSQVSDYQIDLYGM